MLHGHDHAACPFSCCIVISVLNMDTDVGTNSDTVMDRVTVTFKVMVTVTVMNSVMFTD